MRRTVILSVLTVLAVEAQVVVPPVTYKVKDLGALPNLATTTAGGLNGHRVAVGEASVFGTDTGHAAIWRPSAAPVDITGGLTGEVSASAINDAGLVVGAARYAPGSADSFVWDPSSGLHLLPAPFNFGLGLKSVAGLAIDGNGYVPGYVGYEFPNLGLPSIGFPMLWHYQAGNVTYQVLPNPYLKVSAAAAAISQNGIVGGTANGQAALWDMNQGNALRLLGTLPNHTGGAIVRGLDAQAGYAVGSAVTIAGSVSHAFVYFLKGPKAGSFQQLGDPVAEAGAAAVNSSGQVVGYSLANGPRSFAFLWDAQHGFRNLNQLIPAGSGWQLLDATGINDHGEIVGTGWYTAGGLTTVQAYMLVVDDDPPAMHCQNADGAWHANNVTLNCTANDAIAGLYHPADTAFSLSTQVAAGTETANAATGSKQVCDAVGNCTQAGPVTGNKIDRKPPVIACGAADGQWHGSNVTIGCTAVDGGSGPQNPGILLSTSVPLGVETTNASTGVPSACDKVGNCASGAAVSGNKVDRRAPFISLNGIPAGSVFTVGQSVLVRYSCSDAGSGLASCVGDVPADTSFTARGTGSSQFTVNAADKVGNKSQATAPYEVTWGVCAGPQAFALGTLAKIQFTLCDANGVPGGQGIPVTITALTPGSLQGVNTAAQYLGQGKYEFDLPTRGFSNGVYDLRFRVLRDPVIHHLPFTLYVRPAGQ